MSNNLKNQIKDMVEQSDLYKEEIYINDKHEYDYHKHSISDKITVHTLYFSNDDGWNPTLNNKVAMQLVDNGDGIEIIGSFKKKIMTYLESEQLHILLRLSSSSSMYQIAPPTVKTDF
jgi:hypothetical protein